MASLLTQNVKSMNSNVIEERSKQRPGLEGLRPNSADQPHSPRQTAISSKCKEGSSKHKIHPNRPLCSLKTHQKASITHSIASKTIKRMAAR